jgi:hypothetical protein
MLFLENWLHDTVSDSDLVGFDFEAMKGLQ